MTPDDLKLIFALIISFILAIPCAKFYLKQRKEMLGQIHEEEVAEEQEQRVKETEEDELKRLLRTYLKRELGEL